MKKYFITITTIFCSLFMYAQQGFVSVGGDTKNVNGSVSFSVGQLDYNYFSNTSNLVVEGLQQPFELSGALPVTLLYFKAIATPENTVLLTWSTTSENNNDYFKIERSRDANSFEKVSAIPSKGNSTTKQDYFSTDFQPYQGVSYYRLTQADKDGKFSISQVEKVLIGALSFSATASPNPTRDIIQLRISGEVNKKMRFILTDVNGKVLINSMISNINTSINLGNVSQGIYILKVTDGEKTVQSFKIIKNQ